MPAACQALPGAAVKPYYLQLSVEDQPNFMMEYFGYSADTLKVAEQQRWLLRDSKILDRAKKQMA